MIMIPGSEEYLSEFHNGYLTCALWASTGEDGEPLDGLYTLNDVHASTEDSTLRECEDFIKANRADLAEYADVTGYAADYAGHDFFLTRNRHGAGFWDRGAGDVGDRLSDAARACGEADFYAGDDNYVHAS